MDEDEPAFEIPIDVSCIHCGYNLRGLSSDGQCPECGQPILDALSRSKQADPPSPAYRLAKLAILVASVSTWGTGIGACIVRPDCSNWGPLKIFCTEACVLMAAVCGAIAFAVVGFLMVSARARRDVFIWSVLIISLYLGHRFLQTAARA